MKVEEQYDRIVDVYESIPLDGTISVLTGSNGSGKSLVRKQLNFRAKKAKKGGRVVHTSMELRTGLHSNMGGLGVMVRDSEWNPTSYETFVHIETAIRSLHGYYLCLDEIEIGCAVETVMGIVKWLNENLRAGIEDSLGCLVITHSHHVVENLDFDHFFNMDRDETAEEWLNRKIVPTDMDALKNDSMALFRFVTAHSKKRGSRGRK